MPNFFDYPLKEQGKIIKKATIEANKKQKEYMKTQTLNEFIKETEEEIIGIIATGWCTKKNEKKEMDIELVEAIAILVKSYYATKLRQAGEVAVEKFVSKIDTSFRIGDGSRIDSVYYQGYNKAKEELCHQINKLNDSRNIY